MRIERAICQRYGQPTVGRGCRWWAGMWMDAWVGRERVGQLTSLDLRADDLHDAGHRVERGARDGGAARA